MNAEFLHTVLYYNLLFLPIWVAIRFIIFKKNNKTIINLRFEIILYLFAAYIISIAALTLVPLSFAEGNGRGYINMIPIVTQIDVISIARHNHNDTAVIYENIYGNIIMFVPFGFFIPVLFSGKYSFLKVFIVGLLSSFFIEAMQWIEMNWNVYRIVDIDDVILNTFGACLGFFFYKLYAYISYNYLFIRLK